MFTVSTNRGDREFNNFDTATAWARFMRATYELEEVTITHEGQTRVLANWYGKAVLRMASPEREAIA